jgi:hypothetical protein
VSVRTNHEQEELALASIKSGFVCMVITTGDDWTWYVKKTCVSQTEAEAWFDRHVGRARVYAVNRPNVRVAYAK